MLINKARLKISSLIVLSILLIGFNIFFIAYSLQKHTSLQTAGFDLGIWDQKIWGMLNVQPFVITTQAEVEISLGDHVDFVVFGLMLPVYSLFPSPKTLIVVQTLFVSLGALPIYGLARDKLHSDEAALVFAGVYLLFPALGGAVTFDIHGVTMATPILAFALWAMHRQKYSLLILLALLAMGCQEDVPLLTLMLGLYIIVIQRRWRVGTTVVALSLFWFGIANFVIIPLFSLAQDNIHLYRYEALGNSTGEIILTILTRPDIVLQQILMGDKKFYWMRLTMPTAFTALLDPFTLMLAAPSLLINTLSTYPPTYQLDRFHSSAPLVPIIVVASINGVARLVRWAGPKFRYIRPKFLQNVLLAMILIVTLAYQIQFGHTPIGRYFEWPLITEHHHRTQQMLAQVPPDAAVAAQNNLVPHISQREWIFILPKKSQQGRQADYIAIDMSSPLYPYQFIDTYCADIAAFLADPQYGLIFAQEDLLLFQRNAATETIYTPSPLCLR